MKKEIKITLQKIYMECFCILPTIAIINDWKNYGEFKAGFLFGRVNLELGIKSYSKKFA